MGLFSRQENVCSVWKREFDDLADYNNRVSKGIVHTEEYKNRMKILQAEYNREYLGRELDI